MCDTLCAIRPGGALFGKNSDRPPGEVQFIESYPRREPGAGLSTQYLTLPDAGAASVLGARPEWLWGFEHGVNEHRVAIGNEKVWTERDPRKEPSALIGMDLVRLGLERARTAEEALHVMTAFLEEHGQGGIADRHNREPYYSSFLIVDPRSGWVLETSGRTWVAAPVNGTAAVSNRLTLRREWTRSSPDVPSGADWDAWRHPQAPTGHADVRLGASRACLSARPAAALTAADFAAHLRDHGAGPWGAPGGPADVSPPPQQALPDGTGVTVCMHVRGYMATTSSMVAELPAGARAPLRAWVAPGSPCTSVYLPVFPPGGVPPALANPAVWRRFAALRIRVEEDGAALAHIRSVFGPLEAELWAEAEAIAGQRSRCDSFLADAWRRVEEGLARVESAAGVRR
jgi:hypothetical protein